MRRSTIKEIINTSLWETVRRSLATTIITLLPVGAVYLLGGDVLKDFSFAILIGISISAFSTIFIAAPFLAVLLEKSPEYKGRTGREVRAAEPGEKVAPEKVAPVAAGVVEGDGEGPAPTTPPPASPAPAVAPAPATDSKRERRRQRRRARPHGRAR
jgi:hypothetical protein